MPRNALGIAAIALSLAATASLAAKKSQTMSDEEVAGLFASTCGFCHQEGGRVPGKGPQLMDTKRSDAFIVSRIKHGKEGYMPAFGQALTDGQIKGIVHYIRNLKPE
jgi:mono/diheme cytochrome c family protein